MPAIQTYEAQAIRPGHRAQRGDHKGTVIACPVAQLPGAVNLEVRCETHGRNETWKNIPRHQSVHAERAL